MEIVRIAGFTIVVLVLVTLLKQYMPAYAVLAMAGCVVAFFAMFSQYIQPVLAWLDQLAGYVNRQEFGCLLKAAGIALIAQLAQDLCRDAGMNSLGTAVELGGRCLVLASALPIFQKIIERFVAILQ